jgi:hypothetical protein
MNEETRPAGRPSLYTQELADKICAELALGKSMRTVCRPDEMPDMSTVFRWLRTNNEFCKQYARAKEESTDAMAEEVLDIADDSSNDWMLVHKGKESFHMEDKEAVNRSKLRVDTRKWLMSKMKPKKYGDKLDLTSDGKVLPTPIYGGVSTKPEEVIDLTQ